MKKLLVFIYSVLASGLVFAQMPDTTGIYGERKDSLGASVAVGTARGNFLSKTKDMRVEVISATGLCKMACCNLAESFENSASVTVGYSDAVTGARQIRLLGQSGIYTQMLDENRPVMRGLSAPWGLTFIPSQWLESIQVAKGVTSVINGVESMTGQINMEHRKPTDEKPFYLHASAMSDSRLDLNAASSLQLNDSWSTVILAHADGNVQAMDMNGDGFLDDPLSRNFSLSNRWLYFAPSGLQLRFGLRGIADSRLGGQAPAAGASYRQGWDMPAGNWLTDIRNNSADAYLKLGVPLNDANTSNVAVVLDYNIQGLDSKFGVRGYNAGQRSFFANLLYQNQNNENHHFTLGLSGTLDRYEETLFSAAPVTTVLGDAGAFGEYTFHHGDDLSVIAGLRADWYNLAGLRFSPRLTVKWAPVEQIVLRANGGRGLRYSTPLVDNIGVLSTSKALEGELASHPLEDSWTFGGNVTWYLPWDENDKTYLSLDYFGTRFVEQMLVDYIPGKIRFYTLGSIPDSYSRTDNIQLDFSSEPFRGFTLTLTGRFTDARQTLAGQLGDVKPMTSRYKGVLNLQYALPLNKWIFDFTASVNGPCRVWDFMKSLPAYSGGYTPVYPLLYAQVTRRFKGIDIYAGGENLTNYRQSEPIIGASDPFGSDFDASCIWGPLMGIKIYAGIRFTIWKTE